MEPLSGLMWLFQPPASKYRRDGPTAFLRYALFAVTESYEAATVLAGILLFDLMAAVHQDMYMKRKEAQFAGHSGDSLHRILTRAREAIYKTLINA